MVLGTECSSERLRIRSRLAERGLANVPLAGFYSYGEIGKLGAGETRFHNETCVTVAVRSAGLHGAA